MSYTTITAAQRVEIRDSASHVATLSQRFAQNGKTPTDAEATPVVAAMTECAAALTVAGISGIPDTSAVVANGGTVPVQNSAGAAIANATLTVAAGAVTAAKPPATAAGLSNGASRTVPITFVTARAAGATATVAATFTIANGVITAISIA